MIQSYEEWLLEQKREARLLKEYGITNEEFALMLNQQDNCCNICGSTLAAHSQPGRQFCVDHDHKTGKVRGLLCVACNRRLGFVDNYLDKILAHLNLRAVPLEP